MEEITLIHAETQIEMFGNPVDGWYTYADQADDTMFNKCAKLPMYNKVFTALNIPASVWLTGFYQIKYSFGATMYEPYQNDLPEVRKSKVMQRFAEQSS